MKVYLYQNINDIVLNSSSGGAFLGIVDFFYSINKFGFCYGAAFDEKFNVYHCEATDATDSKKFSTSKYCFSNFSKSLPSVASRLESGAAVLFSGTPCQIAALSCYLKNRCINTDNLVTVDIICHGSPDELWWKEYKKWIENRVQSSITKFSFRWKKSRWYGYSLHAEFDNGIEKTNTHDLQVYMDLYFSHHIMKKSCYHCKFASKKRVSDITLGDFWGIKKVMPKVLSNQQISKGVSLVIGNTKKGIAFLEKMYAESHRGEIVIECKNYDFYKYQMALNSPIKIPDDQEEFYSFYNKFGFESTLHKYAGLNAKGNIRFTIKKLLNRIGLIQTLRSK